MRKVESRTVKGDTVEGTAVWTKKRQADILYTFHGTLRKQAASLC
jgi:hypothetical protein